MTQLFKGGNAAGVRHSRRPHALELLPVSDYVEEPLYQSVWCTRPGSLPRFFCCVGQMIYGTERKPAASDLCTHKNQHLGTSNISERLRQSFMGIAWHVVPSEKSPNDLAVGQLAARAISD
ncbi:hypothetical protein H633G_04643 [Metarhizium anisopliae BRIP 53284]|nr:hypothetical protein H633G_04643 [Metarhizium anisopliae BRIP 53284]